MKFKVVSLNIHKGFSLSGGKFTLHELKKMLLEIDPDLCLLQEVVGQHKEWQSTIQGWPSQSQFEFLADSVWPHYSYGKNAVFEFRDHGNAVLSKYPITKIFNHSISTNSFEQRGLLHVQVEIPELKKKIQVFNTQLNLLHFSRRRQLAGIMKEVLKIQASETVLFGGDFNDWRGSLTNTIQNKLNMQEVFLTQHGRHARTFPSVMPILPLDRIYFRNLVLTDAICPSGSKWNTLSDHLPLIAEFNIPE